MRLRTWLLTSTSLAVLAFTPLPALAQDADLKAAYQAFVEAQTNGDDAAKASAQDAFAQACLSAGYQGIDECVTALSGAKPVDQPPAADTAPPADQPPADQPPADQPPADQPPADQPPADQPPADQPPADQPPADQPPAAEQPAAPADQQPAKADAQQQFVSDLNAALGEYQAALNQAAGGDYAGGKTAGDAALAKIQALCTANGYADVKSCVGQDLPPIPEAPAAPAEQPAAPAAEQPAAPAAEQPAAPTDQQPAAPADQQPAAPTDQPAAPADQPAAPAEQPAAPADQPAAEAPAQPDPNADAQAGLEKAASLYNVGIGQLDAGDAAGQSTIDAANQQIADICAGLNLKVEDCLNQFGISLPPVPPAPAKPATPAETPIADLPGADNAVAPETTEVLPPSVKPEDAAPVLDSAKDVKDNQTPAQPDQPVAETPAAPPPTDDKSAQADLKPTKVESVDSEKGEAVAGNDLPTVEVPKGVTIINFGQNPGKGGDNGGGGNNGGNNNGGNNGGGNGGGGGNNGGGGNGGNNGGGRPDKPGNYTDTGFIFKIGVNLVISNPGQDFDRIHDSDRDQVTYERLPGDRTRETITRPGGIKIVTIRNRYGEVLKRSRITPGGREYVLAYYDGNDDEANDPFTNWRDPGDDLPPLRLTIPVRDYILDADDADEDDVVSFFEAPVEQVRRIYTIDEVKRSARIRDSIRRIEVGGLTFDSGAATIARSQVGALSKVANAMLKLLDKNPAETFLIEGHTDATGTDEANLVLSDARAATVARILTDLYDIPPENLVTQGYGERYLKVNTELSEPLNRRVDIKRITPLITLASND